MLGIPINILRAIPRSRRHTRQLEYRCVKIGPLRWCVPCEGKKFHTGCFSLFSDRAGTVGLFSGDNDSSSSSTGCLLYTSTEASLAEATYGTDHLASLHVYLGQRTGIGEIHVFHLVIHTNSLHMGVATAQVDGIIVGLSLIHILSDGPFMK